MSRKRLACNADNPDRRLGFGQASRWRENRVILSLRLIGPAPAALALGACSSIGSGTVPRDRSDYAAAIGDS